MAQSQSPLLRLPAELRNRIYELILYRPDGFKIAPAPHGWMTRLQNSSFSLLRSFRHPLALALCCRQLRHECTGLFFDLNTIVFQIGITGSRGEHVGLYSFEYQKLVQLLEFRLRQVIVYPCRALHTSEQASVVRERHVVARSTKQLLRAGVEVSVKLDFSTSRPVRKIWHDVLLEKEQRVMEALDKCMEDGTVGRANFGLLLYHRAVKGAVREMLLDEWRSTGAEGP